MTTAQKKVSIKKPILMADALKFASDDVLKDDITLSKPIINKVAQSDSKAVSGLIPKGDVRLTANINAELHLKLKIKAAEQRTTIGELIEQLLIKQL
jgi:hypothetical protein